MLALTRRPARMGMGDWFDVFGINVEQGRLCGARKTTRLEGSNTRRTGIDRTNADGRMTRLCLEYSYGLH